MSAITLHPIAEADAAEVLRFELENRTFFERTVAGFGDDYYNLEAVERILAARVQDWAEDASYFYLVRDAGRSGRTGWADQPLRHAARPRANGPDRLPRRRAARRQGLRDGGGREGLARRLWDA